jgi:alpha-1,2-rhamnosyltransferase
VFEECWQRGVDATLVIAGRPADGSQQTLARIGAHPEQARRLFFLGDASDAELDLLYRGARAVILPSLAEGYGLPLVEARQRGCEVLASRLPAFEELADDGVRLFPPGSESGLRSLVEAAAAAHGPPVPGRMPEFTWRDSASQFIAALERAVPASPLPTPGTCAPRSR